MIALIDYMHDLTPLDSCRRHGKQFMYKHAIEGEATKHLLGQTDVFYCVMCLYEYDQEEREIEKSHKKHTCKGVR